MRSTPRPPSMAPRALQWGEAEPPGSDRCVGVPTSGSISTDRAQGRPGFSLGAPEIVAWRATGPLIAVPTEQLRWRADAPGASWVPYGPTAIGKGTVRLVRDGQVRCSLRIQVAPPNLSVRFEPASLPGAGAISIHGLEGGDVHVPEPGSVDVTQSVTDDSVIIRMATEEEAPESVTVLLDWGRKGRLTLELPYPSLTGAYLTPGGERLPDSSTIPRGTTPGFVLDGFGAGSSCRVIHLVRLPWRGSITCAGLASFHSCADAAGRRRVAHAGSRVTSSPAEFCSRTQHRPPRLPAHPHPDELKFRRFHGESFAWVTTQSTCSTRAFKRTSGYLGPAKLWWDLVRRMAPPRAPCRMKT